MLDANLGTTKSAGHFNNVKNRNDNNKKVKCDTFNISDNDFFGMAAIPFLCNGTLFASVNSKMC